MKIIKPDHTDQQVPSSTCRVFLAGSIDDGRALPWADDLAQRLADLPVTIFNPRRDDWDSNLECREKNPVFRHQVNWELDNIDLADVVFFYFAANSISPITLMELGYHLGRYKVPVVYCPDDYWRKGNVEIMCSRHAASVHYDLDNAVVELRQHIELWSKYNV